MTASTVRESCSLPTASGTNDQSAPLFKATNGLKIKFPPLSAVDDATLITRITSLVNTVFLEAEIGIWNEGFQRTNEAQVADFIRWGQLAIAYLEPSPSHLDGCSALSSRLVGCVSIKRLSDTLCTLGMLTLEEKYQGAGLGRELVKFAESHCLAMGCTTMALELLVPTTYAHPLKTRMQAWYTRLGYQLVRLGNFTDDYPALGPLLAGPVEYRMFQKKLV